MNRSLILSSVLGLGIIAFLMMKLLPTRKENYENLDRQEENQNSNMSRIKQQLASFYNNATTTKTNEEDSSTLSVPSSQVTRGDEKEDEKNTKIN